MLDQVYRWDAERTLASLVGLVEKKEPWEEDVGLNQPDLHGVLGKRSVWAADIAVCDCFSTLVLLG